MKLQRGIVIIAHGLHNASVNTLVSRKIMHTLYAIGVHFVKWHKQTKSFRQFPSPGHAENG